MQFPLYAIEAEGWVAPDDQLLISLIISLGLFLLFWFVGVETGSKRAVLINFAALPAYVILPLVFSSLTLVVPIGLAFLSLAFWGVWVLLKRTVLLLKSWPTDAA